jgi:RNA polymerase sigma-70 factor (ECF subfamily)
MTPETSAPAPRPGRRSPKRSPWPSSRHCTCCPRARPTTTATATEQRLVARLTAAIESADLDGLIALLVADVKLAMPPALAEYRGVDAARRVLAAATFGPGRAYRAVPTRANGQPALGLYLADPHTGVHRAYCLLVVTTAEAGVTALTAFSSNVLARFGLPRTLP